MTENSRTSPPLFDRREVLRVGSLSVGASVIPGLDLAAAPFGPTGSAKSVIYLWLGGGVTHIDSFDPKPDAPAEIRGELTAISTRLPGVQFCETMPRMANIADDLAVLRSYSHDSNSHLPSQAYTLSGHKVGRNELFDEPNLGSIVSLAAFGCRRHLRSVAGTVRSCQNYRKQRRLNHRDFERARLSYRAEDRPCAAWRRDRDTRNNYCPQSRYE